VCGRGRGASVPSDGDQIGFGGRDDVTVVRTTVVVVVVVEEDMVNMVVVVFGLENCRKAY
jgi:hypothetical protein